MPLATNPTRFATQAEGRAGGQSDSSSRETYPRNIPRQKEGHEDNTATNTGAEQRHRHRLCIAAINLTPINVMTNLLAPPPPKTSLNRQKEHEEDNAQDAVSTSASPPAAPVEPEKAAAPPPIYL
ncbi:hypothetical protein Pmani_008150 [Petrolisthes manimaculis]|uniref:Uncharacterized protein n=1 Tax=Petrolisthes manimaculis TaxID=1843537 RepID=A0AAE1Q9H3_9EUCA|nr:hypothetical protein Pmani_008150 [Petrolisthes manimaculis]